MKCGEFIDKPANIIQINGELQVMCRNPRIVTKKKNVRRLSWPGHLGRMSDSRSVKESISGETGRKKKSRKTKINVPVVYRELSEIDRCQELGEDSIRVICMCYRYEGGTG